jgi:uncharacterized membrane protein YfcA
MTVALIGILFAPFAAAVAVLAFVQPARRFLVPSGVAGMLLPVVGTWLALRSDERPAEGVVAGLLLVALLVALLRFRAASRRERN